MSTARSQTETELAQPCCLILSQGTDAGPTSPSADPVPCGAWQGSRWSTSQWFTRLTRPAKAGSIPVSCGLGEDALALTHRGGGDSQMRSLDNDDDVIVVLRIIDEIAEINFLVCDTRFHICLVECAC